MADAEDDNPLSRRSRALTGWGRTSPSSAELLTAGSIAAVQAAVSDAGPRGLLARGLGRSYGDQAQNGGGTVLAPVRFGDLDVDPTAQTVTAPAGTSLADVVAAAAPHGLLPPVLPGTGQVTLGGAVANDVHGKNHARDGSIGRWVQRMTLVDGTGRVHELSPDDEAFWATVGGSGLTGVVTGVTLRLVPVEGRRLTVTTRKVPDLDGCLAALAGSTARYAVAWVDCLGPRRGRAIVDEADHADGAEPTAPRSRPRPVAPPLPVTPLTPRTVAAFNAIWWARAPQQATRLQSHGAFFHPLDAVRAWNRLYGPRGLVQWQFALPEGAERTLERIVEQLAQATLAPFLVVLKRFGAVGRAPLSFPLPGWSLAVDLPAAERRAAGVLDRLDAMVADAGGRIYLAKDSRQSPALLASGYPRLDEWRETRERLDPQHRFRSDLGRRLGLC